MPQQVGSGSTSDRDNLSYLEDGDVFYNTETGQLQVRKNDGWTSLTKTITDTNAFKITSGDSVPTVDSNSKEGNIFYNTNTGKLRIREESAWQVTSKQSITDRAEFKTLYGASTPSVNTIQNVFYNTDTKKLQYLKNDAWRTVAEEEVAGDTFNVGVDSYKFSLNNAVQPELNLYRGNEYVFNQSSADNSGQRLFVSNDADGGGGGVVGDKLPDVAMTSNDTTDCEASVSSQYSSWSGYMAFNHIIGKEGWHDSMTGYTQGVANGNVKFTPMNIDGEWIKIRFKNISKMIKEIHIYQRINVNTVDINYWSRAPDEGYIYGSNDDSNWTELIHFTGLASSGGYSSYQDGVPKIITLNSSTAYSYFVMVTTKLGYIHNVSRVNDGITLNISEIELYPWDGPPQTENTTGFTSTGTLGTDLVSTWRVPTDASDTMYYASDGSANMGGTISITDAPTKTTRVTTIASSAGSNGGGDTYTKYAVDVSLNRFTIGGHMQPTLNLYKDSIYKFDQSDPDNVGQRLFVSNDLSGRVVSSSYNNSSSKTNPIILGHLNDSTMNLPRNIAIDSSRKIAFMVGNGNNTLQIINITDPTNMVILSTLSDADMNTPYKVVCDLTRSLVFVGAYGSKKMVIIDVSNPLQPIKKGVYYDSTYMDALRDIVYDDARELLFVTNSSSPGRVACIDVSDENNPIFINGVTLTQDRAFGISLDPVRKRIFVCSFNNDALTVIDVTNPSSGLIIKGTVTTESASPNLLNLAYDVAYDNVRQYVYTTGSRAPGALVVVDVSDPDNPNIVGNLDATLSHPDDYLLGVTLDLERNLAFVAEFGSLDSSLEGALLVIDITNDTPVQIGSVTNSTSLKGPTGVEFDPTTNIVYVACKNSNSIVAIETDSTTSLTENTAGFTSTGTLGTDLVSTWRVPTDASDTMYYASDGSANAGGKINITNVPAQEKTFVVDVSFGQTPVVLAGGNGGLKGTGTSEGTALASSVFSASQNPATKVFNGLLADSQDCWHNASNSTADEWIKFEFPYDVTITSYKMWERTPSTHAYHPVAWKLHSFTSSQPFDSTNYDIDDTNTLIHTRTSSQNSDNGISMTPQITPNSNSIVNDDTFRLFNVPLANQKHGRTIVIFFPYPDSRGNRNNVNWVLNLGELAYYGFINSPTSFVGRKYTLNNELQPTLNLYRDSVYKFDQSDPDNVGQRLYVSNDLTLTENTAGVTSAGTLGTDLVTRWRVPTDASDTMYYASDGSANAGGTINIFNNTNDTTTPTIECLTTSSAVNVISSGSNKYRFNGDTTYVANKYYGLGAGTFTFTGVPSGHSIAILNAGKTSLISYTGDNANKSSKTVSGTTSDGDYDFYHGDVTVTVSGDFGSVSVYCILHGYMGGENLLRYSSSCEIVPPTGGGVTQSGGYNIHTFATSGVFTVYNNMDVEYLIVAGGGGGPGRDIGGGGGAGGMKTGSIQLSAGTYNVIVGPGGGGSTDRQTQITNANKGSISSFNSIECEGGGTGKVYHVTTGNFSNGGSGGGGVGYNPYTAGGTGTAGQGYNGGIGVVYGSTYYGGGGGGGAGEIGKSASAGRDGGDGIQSDITGTNIYYAGGGGGAGHRTTGDGTMGNGGAGGGGDAGTSSTTSSRDGTDGLGGGGGAARNTGLTGGAGGDGIVILRYLL